MNVFVVNFFQINFNMLKPTDKKVPSENFISLDDAIFHLQPTLASAITTTILMDIFCCVWSYGSVSLAVAHSGLRKDRARNLSIEV